MSLNVSHVLHISLSAAYVVLDNSGVFCMSLLLILAFYFLIVSHDLLPLNNRPDMFGLGFSFDRNQTVWSPNSNEVCLPLSHLILKVKGQEWTISVATSFMHTIRVSTLDSKCPEYTN